MPKNWRSGKRNLPPKDPGGPVAVFFDDPMFALFRPRPPLEFKPPIIKRKMPPYSGISSFVDTFEVTPAPLRVKNEIPSERKERILREKREKHEAELQPKIAAYEEEKKKIKSDAYKTLFVGNIADDVSESKLKREFGRYGDLASVTLISDSDGEFKGYGFVEFEREEDMRRAMKRCNGVRLNGKRILVDVERGRTVRGWKPMRLGGGLGNKRSGPTRKENGDSSMSFSARPSYRGNYEGDRGRSHRDSSERRSYDSRRSYGGGSDARSYRENRRDRSRSRERTRRRYESDRRSGTSSRRHRSRSRSRERQRRR